MAWRAAHDGFTVVACVAVAVGENVEPNDVEDEGKDHHQRALRGVATGSAVVSTEAVIEGGRGEEREEKRRGEEREERGRRKRGKEGERGERVGRGTRKRERERSPKMVGFSGCGEGVTLS